MEQEFIIKNLDCAHCAAKIEEAIKNLDGIDEAILNFPMRKIKIKGNINEDMLVKINKLADKIEAGVKITSLSHQHDNNDEATLCHKHNHEHHNHNHCECEHHHEHNNTEKKKTNLNLAVFILGVILFVTAIIIQFVFKIKLVVILYLLAYFLLGWNVLKSTLKNILKGNLFDENFLMTIATIGAFILGEYTEAVGVVLFFKIGELFENYAVSKSRKAITHVAGLKVSEATMLRNENFIKINSDDITIGDILLVKNGERIAADGIVNEGESRLDTSAVNGEPVPLIIRKGDKILSGCINLADAFTMTATAPASESMISKIARAVEDASAQKPQIDRFITRFSKIYTPVVIIIAILTAVLGSVLTGETQKWIYSALTFLVISCPCALVLSVPLAYFSGIGAASKIGILFKGGSSMEALGKVKTIVFDKTGTLTDGSFSVTDIYTCCNVTKNELLEICGSCEQTSTHPIAESITKYCRESDITISQPQSSGEIAGKGVYAVLNNKNILCGNEKLMAEKNILIPDMPQITLGNIVFVAVDNEIIGRIVVSDSIKKSSADAIKQLRSMNIHTAMLTGDKIENALAVGNTIGINEIIGGLMPDEKLMELNRIRSEKGAVMFVGDGINDAPVLAGADVGGAMHNGSDIALEAADAVFMKSEPSAVVEAKKIADKTLRISYQNIIFALTVKAAVLVLGLLGHPNMWLAVFADSGVAMLLILNSIRALNTRK